MQDLFSADPTLVQWTGSISGSGIIHLVTREHNYCQFHRSRASRSWGQQWRCLRRNYRVRVPLCFTGAGVIFLQTPNNYRISTDICASIFKFVANWPLTLSGRTLPFYIWNRKEMKHRRWLGCKVVLCGLFQVYSSCRSWGVCSLTDIAAEIQIGQSESLSSQPVHRKPWFYSDWNYILGDWRSDLSKRCRKHHLRSHPGVNAFVPGSLFGQPCFPVWTLGGCKDKFCPWLFRPACGAWLRCAGTRALVWLQLCWSQWRFPCKLYFSWSASTQCWVKCSLVWETGSKSQVNLYPVEVYIENLPRKLHIKHDSWLVCCVPIFRRERLSETIKGLQKWSLMQKLTRLQTAVCVETAKTVCVFRCRPDSAGYPGTTRMDPHQSKATGCW